MPEASLQDGELLKKYYKAVASLLINIEPVLQKWYVTHRAVDPWPNVVPYLAQGVVQGYLSRSVARFAFAQHIKQLQGMEKHGKLIKEGSNEGCLPNR